MHSKAAAPRNCVAVGPAEGDVQPARKDFLLPDTLPYKVQRMSIRAEAEENLRVIRSLMEKATVYRAISAPGALVGGLAALAISACAIGSKGDVPFVPVWLGALALTSVANFFLLHRDAARRGEPFVSPGMRLALRAMLPGFLGGGLCLFVAGAIGPALLAALWVLFYGISLLAAAHFAPKSICWLGRAFFAAGAALLGSGVWFGGDPHVIMGATFGVFHLVYAACTWPRRAAAPVPAAAA